MYLLKSIKTTDISLVINFNVVFGRTQAIRFCRSKTSQRHATCDVCLAQRLLLGVVTSSPEKCITVVLMDNFIRVAIISRYLS